MLNYIKESPDCQGIFSVLNNLNERKREHSRLLPALIEAFKDQEHYSEDKAHRISDCASFLEITPGGKIVSANFCKNRFCPICQWRASIKTFGKVAQLQERVEREFPQYQYIFITFTLENSKTLSEGLQAVLQGFNNLTHDRTFRAAQKGFIRSVEVTYKAKDETWHPHIHAVLAVSPDYFSQGYLTNRAWQKLWKRAARLDYAPVVDVRAVHDDKYKAVAEIVKYAVKPFDLKAAAVKLSDLYSELIASLYNRRLRSFAGIYKKLARELGLNSPPDLLDSDIERGKFFVYQSGEYIAKAEDGKGVSLESGEVVDITVTPWYMKGVKVNV